MPTKPELLTARLRDERGFTLVEVMIALVIGLVVSSATLAIVIISVHLSSNYTDRVDANQQGRLAMEKITQALNSSCVTPNQPPVLSGSSSTSLTFYSALNDTPGPVPSLITVTTAGTPTQAAPLTMTTTVLTGTPPNWVPFTPLQVQVFTLASWAAESVSAGSPTPIFQYYGYGSGGTISPTAFVLTGGVLSTAQAAATAEVQISYQVLPSDDWNATGRPADFTDAVVFRLTPPSSSANAANLPCT
jgi:prepilin-type N-terminal cleavage/methylation domain-containing protein